MNTIFFVRHGMSQANVDRIIAREDSPLTDEGRASVRHAATQLKNQGILTIIASPLLRAQQTAAIIAEEVNINPTTIQTLDDLRERNFGPLKGHPKMHDSLWYIDTEADDIESRQDLYLRMQRAYQALAAQAQHGPIIAVGHAVSGFYLLQASKQKASIELFEPSFQLTNAQVIILGA